MFSGRYTGGGGGRDNSPRHHERLARSSKDARSVSPRPRVPSGENGGGAGGASESKSGEGTAASKGAPVLDLLAGGDAAPASPRGNRNGSRGRADSQVTEN